MLGTSNSLRVQWFREQVFPLSLTQAHPFGSRFLAIEFHLMSSPDDSFLKKLTSLIPGFGGYLTLESRREDDRLTREYLIRRLQECKSTVEDQLRPAVESMDFDLVAQGEKLRQSIEHEQNRIRAAVDGYSSWFDKREVDDELLKRIGQMDADLIGIIDRMHDVLQPSENAPIQWTSAESMLRLLHERFDRRRSTLRDA
jgi:hypothetical protein